MKILHISSSDSVGGAARSAFNLHQNLLEHGIESVYFAAEKSSNNESVVGFKFGYLKRRLLALIDQLPVRRYVNRTKHFPFSTNWFWLTGIKREIRKIKPDLIHLHWIGKGIFRLEHLNDLNLPIVWTMHDNFAFTGGCHLVNECDHFIEVCGSCPQLGSGSTKDLSNKNFNRKKRLYGKLKISFIAPSSWMQLLGRQSKLLYDQEIFKIPNVGSKNYFGVDRRQARNAMLLEEDKKIVLFGALNATQDVNKGFSLLLDALASFAEMYPDTVVCVFGSAGSDLTIPNVKINYLGYLHDDLSKRIMYSAADVTIVPSRIENLSNVIMESMACGTPVVAFRTGGNSDLIEHKTDGFLADEFSAHALMKGLQWVFEESNSAELRIRTAQKIRSSFAPDICTKAHIDLYSKLIDV